MSDHQTILCQDVIIMEYYPMIVGYSGPDFFRIWLCVQTLVPLVPTMDGCLSPQSNRPLGSNQYQTSIRHRNLHSYQSLYEKKTVIQFLIGKCREHLNRIFQTSCNRTCIDLKDLQNMS